MHANDTTAHVLFFASLQFSTLNYSLQMIFTVGLCFFSVESLVRLVVKLSTCGLSTSHAIFYAVSSGLFVAISIEHLSILAQVTSIVWMPLGYVQALFLGLAFFLATKVERGRTLLYIKRAGKTV